MRFYKAIQYNFTNILAPSGKFIAIVYGCMVEFEILHCSARGEHERSERARLMLARSLAGTFQERSIDPY